MDEPRGDEQECRDSHDNIVEVTEDLPVETYERDGRGERGSAREERDPGTVLAGHETTSRSRSAKGRVCYPFGQAPRVYCGG